MMRMSWLLVLAPSFLWTGCSDGGRTADVVQAATKGAADVGQQLAAKAAELTGMTAEEAHGKVQEFLDLAARELKEIRDSETAQRLAADVQRVLETLGVFAQRIGEKLNVAGLQASLQELIERFKNDPRVTSALKNLHEKLESLSR